MTISAISYEQARKKPMGDIIEAWRTGPHSTQQTFNFIGLKENIAAAAMEVESLKTCNISG